MKRPTPPLPPPSLSPTPTPTHQQTRGKYQTQRSSLPVYAHRISILQALSTSHALIVVGETGSGKSTQVPQFVLEGGLCDYDAARGCRDRGSGDGDGDGGEKGKKKKKKHKHNQDQSQSFVPNLEARAPLLVTCTQPRRVAAITVATRVSFEQTGGASSSSSSTASSSSSSSNSNSEVEASGVGGLVGYRVRFDDHTSPSTRILYQTDGMLLREASSTSTSPLTSTSSPSNNHQKSGDPLLSKYAVIILDEAHERSLRTDVLFGIVKRAMAARNYDVTTGLYPSYNTDSEDVPLDVQEMRKEAQRRSLPPLKVIVMSATLNVETFSNYFEGSVAINVPGRQYPVEVLYLEEGVEDFNDGCLAAALRLHDEYRGGGEGGGGGEGEEEEEWGDILIFLPGQEEIEDLAGLLRRHLAAKDQIAAAATTPSTPPSTTSSSKKKNKDVVLNLTGLGSNITPLSTIHDSCQICTLYSSLPPQIQMLAFSPTLPGGKRKIIISTNIAETSVTLSKVVFVIDSGFQKVRSFASATGIESLEVMPISKAQALQRSGRSGRTRPGVCIRLYTESAYDELQTVGIPEILRVNLSSVVIQLKAMGVHDPRTFPFITPPSMTALVKAFELLYSLTALDKGMNMTKHGGDMARLPLDPVYGHLLLLSAKYGCVKEMLDCVGMLSSESVFYRPPQQGASADDAGGGSGGGEDGVTAKVADAHKRFASYEGDLPTLLFVYQSWKKEAYYHDSTATSSGKGGGGGGGSNRKKTANEIKQLNKIPHGEWCAKNYINGRAIVTAYNVRAQLSEILKRDVHKGGLGFDVGMSCGGDLMMFYRNVCAGLFLNVATRNVLPGDMRPKKNDTSAGSGGKYKLKSSNLEVNVHPTSTLFMRNPAPRCVVFTEVLVTKKTYIRGVTQVREEWLAEVAPQMFK